MSWIEEIGALRVRGDGRNPRYQAWYQHLSYFYRPSSRDFHLYAGRGRKLRPDLLNFNRWCEVLGEPFINAEICMKTDLNGFDYPVWGTRSENMKDCPKKEGKYKHVFLDRRNNVYESSVNKKYLGRFTNEVKAAIFSDKYLRDILAESNSNYYNFPGRYAPGGSRLNTIRFKSFRWSKGTCKYKGVSFVKNYIKCPYRVKITRVVDGVRKSLIGEGYPSLREAIQAYDDFLFFNLKETRQRLYNFPEKYFS